jgi:hypothetical protein
MRNVLMYAMAGILIGVAGYVSANQGDPAPLNRAAARLDRVPMKIGTWSGAQESLEPGIMEQARIQGYTLRRYTDEATGAVVSLLIVCGRPGPVSVHTPDVCYGGAGYGLEADPTAFDVEGVTPPARFRVGNFMKEQSTQVDRLRVFWSWSTGDGFEEPTRPRLAYAMKSYLYKIYVVRSVIGPYPAIEDDPAVAFLKAAVPVLHEALRPSDAGAARPSGA